MSAFHFSYNSRYLFPWSRPNSLIPLFSLSYLSSNNNIFCVRKSLKMDCHYTKPVIKKTESNQPTKWQPPAPPKWRWGFSSPVPSSKSFLTGSAHFETQCDIWCSRKHKSFRLDGYYLGTSQEPRFHLSFIIGNSQCVRIYALGATIWKLRKTLQIPIIQTKIWLKPTGMKQTRACRQ